MLGRVRMNVQRGKVCPTVQRNVLGQRKATECIYTGVGANEHIHYSICVHLLEVKTYRSFLVQDKL